MLYIKLILLHIIIYDIINDITLYNLPVYTNINILICNITHIIKYYYYYYTILFISCYFVSLYMLV